VPLPEPVPLLPLLPDVPLPEPLPVPELELPPEPVLLGLIADPPEEDRTEPEPLQAASEITVAMIADARHVCLNKLPEEVLRMIVTPRTLCVPSRRSTCSGCAEVDIYPSRPAPAFPVNRIEATYLQERESGVKSVMRVT
jgi:hypothetical protein